MATQNDKLVLRTVYLPFDLDQELKSIAFRNDRSKNELIREFVRMGMQAAKEKGDTRFRTFERIGGPVATEKLKSRIAIRKKAKAAHAKATNAA